MEVTLQWRRYTVNKIPHRKIKCGKELQWGRKERKDRLLRGSEMSRNLSEVREQPR